MEAHADRVKHDLLTNGKTYWVDETGAWMLASWKSGPKYCFKVVHSRDQGAHIVVFYSFLLFR